MFTLSRQEIDEGRGAFVGEIVEEKSIPNSDVEAVLVRVEGFAYYTGFHTLVEELDDQGYEGFLIERNDPIVINYVNLRNNELIYQ